MIRKYLIWKINFSSLAKINESIKKKLKFSIAFIPGNEINNLLVLKY